MICRVLVFYYLGFLFLMSLPHLHIHFYFDYRNTYGNYKLIWSILPCLIMETKQLRRTYLYLKGNNVKWFEQKKYFSTESTKVFQEFLLIAETDWSFDFRDLENNHLQFTRIVLVWENCQHKKFRKNLQRFPYLWK